MIPKFYRDNKHHVVRLFTLLKEKGIRQILIHFDGCGDSGNIDSIEYDGDIDDHVKLFWPTEKSTWNPEKRDWDRKYEMEQRIIGDIVTELGEEILEKSGYDWVNNDGGYGEITIDVESGHVDLDMNIRYTESYNHFRSDNLLNASEES